MSSLYKRIESSSVKYGQSFVLSDFEETKNDNIIKSFEEQKAKIQQEIQKATADLAELKTALSDLYTQKDSIIDDAKKVAEEIKTQAVLNSEEIIAEANKNKADIENEAIIQGNKQGFEAGYNDALEKFKNDYSKQIKSLEALVGVAFDVKNEIIYSSENEITQLALLIAEKIEGVKFKNDVNVFKNMTQQALSLLNEKENIKIVVNPKLIEYAREITPELAEKLETLEQIKIVQDKILSEDGAIIESISSRIDYRISTQIETLAQALLANKIKNKIITDEIEDKIKSKLEEANKDD